MNQAQQKIIDEEFGNNTSLSFTNNYKFSGSKYKPFKHQIVTASFLTSHKKAFCFNEQGTGKTASSLWASDYLIQQGVIKRVLIICPISIMDSAWRNDVKTFVPHLSCGIAHGTPKKRLKIISEGNTFTVINYEGIKSISDHLHKFDLIIVDEATHYKNVQTARWKALYQGVEDSTWLWLMTGTPAAQGPTDAFGLARLVNPSGVPKFFGHFRAMTMRQITQFKWIPQPYASKIVHKALQPAIRFTKEECLDLPPMMYTKREAELTRMQKKYYAELRSQMVIEAAGEEITAVNAAVAMNKLLQISAGAVYSDDRVALQFDIGDRYKVLEEIIAEASKKVLVFLPYKHVIEVVKQRLTRAAYTVGELSGRVPIGDRDDIIKRFQNEPDPQILLIQPRTAAHGVTLTAADTIVWWSPTSSLETYAQANARIHRAGQTHKCTIVRLEGSPVERRYWALLDNKTEIHTEIISLYKEVIDSDK
jgi:SNF2 family DNA or RNA helicase